jgi:hypothetical protein
MDYLEREKRKSRKKNLFVAFGYLFILKGKA